MRAIRYGVSDSQTGDLHLPDAPRPPVVCLLHGGFWRVPWGRDQLEPVARDLARRGLAVWNVGYRRVGEPGGGWPGTLHDVAAAVDRLADIVEGGIELDLGRIVVAGHSAGGQLALWAAARRPREPRGPQRVRPIAVAALAAVTDLARCFTLDSGDGAVAAFVGGGPDLHPARFAAASPMALLPLGVRQLVLHGRRDEALPVELARDYAAAAGAAGDDVEPAETEAGHMDYLDPASESHRILRGWIGRVVGAPEA